MTGNHEIAQLKQQSVIEDPQQDLSIALERMGLLRPGEGSSPKTLAGRVSSNPAHKPCPRVPQVFPSASGARWPSSRSRPTGATPVERNHAEVEWLRVADALAPGCVRASSARTRKRRVRDGIPGTGRTPGVEERVARRQHPHRNAAGGGARDCAIHAGTAQRADMAQRFANDHIFTRSAWSPT